MSDEPCRGKVCNPGEHCSRVVLKDGYCTAHHPRPIFELAAQKFESPGRDAFWAGHEYDAGAEIERAGARGAAALQVGTRVFVGDREVVRTVEQEAAAVRAQRQWRLAEEQSRIVTAAIRTITGGSRREARWRRWLIRLLAR